MEKINVSFDFDGTLENKHVQEYAKELLKRDNIEVWIVTSRFGNDELYKRFYKTSSGVDLVNTDLWEVANELGIPEERVHFTDMDNKYHFFIGKDFAWHLDDDWVENRLILSKSKSRTKGINVWGNSSWKQKCEKTLNNIINLNI